MNDMLEKGESRIWPSAIPELADDVLKLVYRSLCANRFISLMAWVRGSQRDQRFVWDQGTTTEAAAFFADRFIACQGQQIVTAFESKLSHDGEMADFTVLNKPERDTFAVVQWEARRGARVEYRLWLSRVRRRNGQIEVGGFGEFPVDASCIQGPLANLIGIVHERVEVN